MAAPKRPTALGAIRAGAGALGPAEPGAGTEPNAVAPVRDAGTAPASRVASLERQRPVRITIDLVPELHAFLKAWAGERGIVAADVIRQLVRELRDDATLRARVEAEIEARQARVREAQRLAQE
jgi:hypothetical protein